MLPKVRPPDKSQEWNDGYSAALVAIIRVAVERAHTH
jgi:hypothetical protein